MTTENTHPEHHDWQAPVGEQSSASENPSLVGAPRSEEQASTLEVQPEEAPAKGSAEHAPSSEAGEEQSVRQEEPFPVLTSDNQKNQPEQAEVEVPGEVFTDETASVSEMFVLESASPLESETLPLFDLEQEQPLSEAEAVRPFTDFIEEFRQTEVRLNTLLQDQETDFATLAIENKEEASALPEAAGESAQTVDTTALEEQKQPEDVASESASASQAEEAQPALTQPTFPKERPVSPLLRPATRIRLPRHGRHRIEELVKPAELHGEVAKPAAETKAESTPVAEVPQAEAPEARPVRRYRFDRPAATPGVSPSVAKPAPTQASVRAAEAKEKRAAVVEHKQSIEAAVKPVANVPAVPDVPAQKVSEKEATPEVSAPVTPPSERRRRGNHDRLREKELAAAPVPPVAEVVTPEKEPEPALETPVEDLPPLEYAELQAANSRRRRRRRVANGNGVVAPKAALPELAPPPAPTPAPPAAAVALPKSVPAAPVTPPAAQNYNIVSGYTVSQMNLGNDNAGPFMGPEPSPARGSTFTTSPQLRHSRNEALRSAPTHPVKPGESPIISPASINHLGNVVAQAIQIQTDRMVSELRRANQVPTNISVSLPPFPSNERVGVFVDVANLLYSARTLRMTVDFGKLLDFLRGNRRLVRAQAYCPTSPQPGDDQMFLQAVKGLGYRITTKNYKTFSSGAKKADLDLDLCMDVVRLVDGKAVDCVVLVSGDSDFMPMLDYCSDHGVRVEVAAFDESMSATLRQACDLFVNLSMLEEIRA